MVDIKFHMASPFFPREEIDTLLTNFSEILEGKSQLSMGPKVIEFENLFAEYVGSQFAVATNSCSAALEIALRSIGVGGNDEIVVPVETFIATGAVVVREGAKPVFCDIDPETFCMSLTTLKKCITPKTKAVIIVHMAGLITPDIFEIRDLCHENGIILIEDAAHAIGASIQGISAGNLGDIGCFSFYPTKIITTAEGGMLVCSDKHIYEEARSFQNRGRDMTSKTELYSRLGTNNRMTELSALLGISQLKTLKSSMERRRAVAKIYNDRIINARIHNLVKITPILDRVEHSYWRYLITLDPSINRELIQIELLKEGISSDWAYYPPLHLQPVFREKYQTRKGMLPIAEDILKRNICLPIHAQLTHSDAEFIVEKFISAVLKQS